MSHYYNLLIILFLIEITALPLIIFSLLNQDWEFHLQYCSPFELILYFIKILTIFLIHKFNIKLKQQIYLIKKFRAKIFFLKLRFQKLFSKNFILSIMIISNNC